MKFIMRPGDFGSRAISRLAHVQFLPLRARSGTARCEEWPTARVERREPCTPPERRTQTRETDRAYSVL